MFAVVKFADSEKGFFKNMFSGFKKKRISAEKVTVAPGTFYFLLTCNFTYERADWDMIEEYCGPAKSRVIFQGFVKAPERFAVCGFQKLRKRAFILTALEILKTRKCQSIVIDDRDGDYINDIEKFMALAPVVKVITCCPERYEQAEERIMENCGASLLFGDENAELDNTWLVTYRGGAWRGEGIKAITAADVCFGAEKLIRLTDLAFADEQLDLVPEGIDSAKFLSALYECSHAMFLERTLFRFDEPCGT